MAFFEPFWKGLSGNEHGAENLNLCTGAGIHFILGASYKDMNLGLGSVDRYVYIRWGVSRLWDFFFLWSKYLERKKDRDF